MTGDSRPSLRDVSAAPGARLRRQRAHMGFAERSSGGWRAAGCPTTSWRMGTSVSAPLLRRLDSKRRRSPLSPFSFVRSFVRCPFSSPSRSRDAKVSRHHRSSDDRISYVLRAKRCYARISQSQGYNLTRNTTINVYVEH